MNYIYGLFCPVALTIRYVGKSTNPSKRLEHHLSTCNRTKHHAGRWLASLKRKFLRPELIILAEIEDGGDWESFERSYIASGESLGWKLTNTTPGGEGGGYVRPEDRVAWVEKITKALSSDEVRGKISKGVRKAYENPATRQKICDRAAKQWRDPEWRARAVKAMSDAASRPEAKKIVSERGMRIMSQPGAREEVGRKLSAYYATAEGRENKARTSNLPAKVEASRAAQIKAWQRPEYREKQMAAMTAPHVIQGQKDKARSQWADPEIRARMLAAMKAAAERRKKAI